MVIHWIFDGIFLDLVTISKGLEIYLPWNGFGVARIANDRFRILAQVALH